MRSSGTEKEKKKKNVKKGNVEQRDVFGRQLRDITGLYECIKDPRCIPDRFASLDQLVVQPIPRPLLLIRLLLQINQRSGNTRADAITNYTASDKDL